MYKLSEGSLDQIMNGRNIEQPVLQLLNYKKLRGATSDQYRLVVSDGIKIHKYTMLSTELNYLFENGTLTKNAVFKVFNYKVRLTDDEKKVLIIMNGEVLVPTKEVQRVIENPTETNKFHSSTATHHKVMEDTVQPSTSRDINNFFCKKSTIPIKVLNHRNREPIKARVINKSPIKEWKKNNSSGKWFSMHLVDNSDEIRCVAFNNICNKFHNELENNKVYYISNYKLQNTNQQYNKLKHEYEIVITENTEIKKCHDDASMQWMQVGQRDGDFNAPLLTFREVIEAGLGENPHSPDFFTVVATINSINTYSIYKACSKKDCKKKLIDLSSNKFKCEKCGRIYTNFNYGLMLDMNISDTTGSRRISAFNQIAEDILGMSVQTLGELKENGNNVYEQKINEVVSKQYAFLVKGQAKDFKGSMRANYTCVSIAPISNINYN